ncbi:MAG TPA: cupin domain-containing protein [Bacteriovoracaceae bacterium]|nr:cupin domain-containing protein [Bacteriovoracaceae bacterium]
MKTSFAAYIPSINEPVLIAPGTLDLRIFQELPFLSSLYSLLNSWPNTIQAHLPDVRDEASSIDTNPKDAQKLFENGMGLLFNDVQAISPLLSEYLQVIRRDLGLSAMTYGRCLIYATPDGKGTAPHFDQNINFVLQIHGTKIWHMAPNQHVVNPLSRHTMGQPIDPELMSYTGVPMPDKMPADALRFELKPGSLLFVPRGFWHSTEAEGDALALNFTFSAPSWLDLLSAALRSRLALSPEWRETAVVENAGKFDYLLSSLTEDLPNWRASDILAATESQDEGLE